MQKFTMCAPCLFGLEKLVANELKFMGAEEVEAQNGRVLFKGGYDILIRANIRSRFAERIVVLLGEFTARSFEELFNGVEKLPFENFILENEAFPVSGSTLDSKLYSVPDCQKIVKKAVAKRLSKIRKTDWLNESGGVHQIKFLVRKDKASIMLDTTGVGLYKRGYRAESNSAPIKETLAAAMVELSKVRKDHFVVDPMCGSGTILIEAALSAMKIFLGAERSFAAENWACIPKALWDKERADARAMRITDCNFKATGFDIDVESLKIAKSNAKKAGVDDRITFIQQDVKDFIPAEERGTLITNPPYGERMLSVNEAEELYFTLGKRFKKKRGWSYAIITPDDDFEKCFGREADKRRKLYNGMLKCQLYMYFKAE